MCGKTKQGREKVNKGKGKKETARMIMEGESKTRGEREMVRLIM